MYPAADLCEALVAACPAQSGGRTLVLVEIFGAFIEAKIEA